MKLSVKERSGFLKAATILAQNRRELEKYADRSEGITNGDSVRKKRALAILLSK